MADAQRENLTSALACEIFALGAGILFAALHEERE
jgi:hypothetical protein